MITTPKIGALTTLLQYADPPCRTNPDAWFPDTCRLTSENVAALHACHHCPLMYACQQAADQLEGSRHGKALHGIWGGETPTQRYARRKDRTPPVLQLCEDALPTCQACGLKMRPYGEEGAQFPDSVPTLGGPVCVNCTPQEENEKGEETAWTPHNR